MGVTVTATVVPKREASGWVSTACTRTVATIANAAPTAATASTAGQRTEPTRSPTPTTAATAINTDASAAHGPHHTPTAVTVQHVKAAGTNRKSIPGASGAGLAVTP
ncbi:hypothetical protein NCCNTM_45870 [Mycolicibacterium sp. NCC-Tsukiji]|nr:hypothetical protein NCCNTM_45870 [Mycolicibacterium sp. NCC-Tsukiji]